MLSLPKHLACFIRAVQRRERDASASGRQISMTFLSGLLLSNYRFRLRFFKNLASLAEQAAAGVQLVAGDKGEE